MARNDIIFLLLSFHLCLGLSSGLFLFDISTKILYVLQDQSILLVLITLVTFGEEIFTELKLVPSLLIIAYANTFNIPS